ncbi:MAG: hypothetical protein K0S07_1073 [Chlamydiales bacterium]|nr:hypothetical protein [Chlamydiales bacterium]
MDFMFFSLKNMPQMGTITLSFPHDQLSTTDSHRQEVLRQPTPAMIQKKVVLKQMREDGSRKKR